jgi:hypothetical protein
VAVKAGREWAGALWPCPRLCGLGRDAVRPTLRGRAEGTGAPCQDSPGTMWCRDHVQGAHRAAWDWGEGGADTRDPKAERERGVLMAVTHREVG